MDTMVAKVDTLFRLMLLFILALLLFAGCEDVPLDGSTAVRDTLSEPDRKDNDTVPTPLPTPAQSTVTLTYNNKDVSGPGGSRRRATFAIRAEITIDTVFEQGRPLEIAKILLDCPIPDSVRLASVTERTNIPTNLRHLEINVPHMRIPLPGDDSRVYVDGDPDRDDRPSAVIMMAFPSSDRMPLKTGKNGSKGTFRIEEIDRIKKLLICEAEFEFRVREFGDDQIIRLWLDLKLGY
jgi:hypothetical protein